MVNIQKSELLGKVLRGLTDGGWKPIVIDTKHPFLVRAVSDDGAGFNLRVYIWNCTHGGGGRDANEFRIQVTSAVPQVRRGEITALLGWHADLSVFAAWDIKAHAGQDSASPSCQIRAETLEAAHDKSFATQVKDNEIVVAFQSFLIGEYALASASLHGGGAAAKDMSLLDSLPTLADDEIAEVANAERRTVIRSFATKFRAHHFRDRVLEAYQNQCAFCGIQLGLVDAAHIVPVSARESTDEIVNGVALCKLHHFAYDSNLVSFDARYAITTSRARAETLRNAGLLGGWGPFRDGLRKDLILPRDERNRPNIRYVEISRRIRGWHA